MFFAGTRLPVSIETLPNRTHSSAQIAVVIWPKAETITGYPKP